MSYIEDMITFSKFLIKFRSITRVIDFSYDTRSENDAEHSWYLAMMAWYIISTKKLNLSLEKVLLYCIAHDLVEIYA